MSPDQIDRNDRLNAPRLTGEMTIGANQDMVRNAIGRAAQRTGVDFSYLLNQAKSESGLNPNARAATSSASGLFQFIDQSWLGVVKQHGAKHGMAWAANAIGRTSAGRWTVNDPQMRDAVFALRNQAEPSALMAAESASQNAADLSQSLGRPVNQADLYFAHFLGVQGAARYLKARDANPGATAAAVFPREASVNRGLFYTKSGEARSLDDLYALMARKIGGGGGDVTAPTSFDPAAAMRMANAGDLVPVPEGSPDGDIRLIAGADLPSSALPDDGNDDGNDAASMMAMLEHRSGINMVRPNPQTARLAYLLLAADLDDPTVTSA
jgi:hypothetical protein